MNLLFFIQLLSGAILLGAGLLVARKKRLHYYTRPFLLLVAVNLAGIAAIIIETGPYSSLWNFGYKLLYFYVSFLPLAWYVVGARWGVDVSERSRKHPMISTAFGGMSLVLFIYLWVTQGVDLPQADEQWYLDLGKMRLWSSAYLIIAATAGAYAIEVCFRSSLGLSRERIKRSFFPLLAYSIALLGAATLGILYGRIDGVLLTSTFLLAALVSIPVGRHYLLFDPVHNGIILTRRGFYSSIVVIIFGIYFLLMGTVGELLLTYDLGEGVFFSVVILILMVITFMILVISQTVRSRLRVIMSPRTPARSRAMYSAEWKEFAEEVSVTMTIDAIYAQSAELLRRLLRIENSLFVIKEPAPSENYVLYCGESADRGIPGAKLHLVTDWLYRFGHPVETATLAEKAPDEAAQIKSLEGSIPFALFMLVPLIARQQSLGFWGIGYHNGDRPLTSDEIGFIEAAANPVALTILGARMTDELLVSHEIESFHRFSSFVLHDLKNSVAMLSMLLQNAEKNISNPEFQREALATISRAVNRQQKIISRLTEDKAGEKLTFRKVDLRSLIDSTLERIKLDSVRTVSVEIDVASGLTVIVDRDKIGSVFDNLVMNALEAMPHGGRLVIRSVPSAHQGLAAVSFADTGAGMDQEFIATRLFKPFSSTKSHGLGIGLFQSREIVKAHRGKMEVISEPGKGTEFIIYLPGDK